MNDENLPFWRLFGLAVKAGRVISGSDAVESAIRRQKGPLLIIANDVSQASTQRFLRLAQSHQIDVVMAGDKETMGHWSGKAVRAAALITEAGFAKRLKELAESAAGPEDKGE